MPKSEQTESGTGHVRQPLELKPPQKPRLKPETGQLLLQLLLHHGRREDQEEEAEVNILHTVVGSHTPLTRKRSGILGTMSRRNPERKPEPGQKSENLPDKRKLKQKPTTSRSKGKRIENAKRRTEKKR